MKSKALWWAVLVVGVALVVAPFAMGLPAKSAAGQRMIDDFTPIMAPDQVQKTADYYYNVFTPLGGITPLFSDANATKFQNYLTGMRQAGITLPPAAANDFTQLIGTMKQAVPVAQRVPAGLQHYKPLVVAMQGNVNDFEKLSSLPTFTLFTWFFVVPGLLLVLLAGLGLYSVDALHIHLHRPHPAA